METHLDVENKDKDRLKEDTTDDNLNSLFSSSLLPNQNHGLDQPLEASEFKDHVATCEDNLKKALSVLNNNGDSMSLNKKLVINTILLCGEHSRRDLWTSPQTIIYAEKLLDLVIARCNCTNIIDLLLHCKIDFVLNELRPKLLKNTWKNNPAAVACFIWILSQIKCPYLGDVFNIVLPTCLLLIDDHEYGNKIKGLECLQHLSDNVSRAELNQYGRGSVIYSALEHMIYIREHKIIPPLAACLTALLSKTEQRSTTEILAWSHFDDVLNIWLPSMEMEQKLLLREAYTESLVVVLQAMGLASVRWSRKLLSVLAEYCEQDHTRDKALLNLLTFMKITWPRLSFNFEQIVVILMKVVIRISKTEISEESSHHSLESIRQCFTLLETHCYKKYDVFANEMKSNSDLRDCFLLITGH